MGQFSLKAKPPPAVFTHCFPAHNIFFFLHTLYFFLGYAFFTTKLQTDSKEMETEVVERKKPDSSLIDASCDFL